MELTPWYLGTVKPVRVGVYERWYPLSESEFFCFWDGNNWHSGTSSMHRSSFEGRSRQQELKWRGLTQLTFNT